MKTLLLAIIVLSLAACENKKAAIVDRQRVLKRQIDSIQANYLQSLKADRDTIDYLKAATDQRYLKSSSKRAVQIQTDILFKQIPLQREYDSLEMELKKY